VETPVQVPTLSSPKSGPASEPTTLCCSAATLLRNLPFKLVNSITISLFSSKNNLFCFCKTFSSFNVEKVP